MADPYRPPRDQHHETREEIARDVEQQGMPTTDKPLNGPRRPKVLPLVLTALFLLTLALLYFFGLDVLVPAD